MFSLTTRQAVVRLVVAATATTLFAACADSPTSPTSGSRVRPPQAAQRDDVPECRSGYILVDGRWVCGD